MTNNKRYDKNFKIKCVRQFFSHNVSIGMFAKIKKIPKQTLARWLRKYSLLGESGLENKNPGLKETFADPKIERLILKLWNEKKRSAYSMRRNMRVIGVDISEWHIRKIYKKYNMIY